MRIGTSPVTNTIYAGNTKISKKDGMELWTKKEDVTDDAIRAVFEWFVNNSKDDGNSIYQISYKGFGTLSYDPNEVLKEKEGGDKQ